jgi:hypothetical protein
VLRRAQKRICRRLEFVDANPGVRRKHPAEEYPHIRVVTRVVLGEHLS